MIPSGVAVETDHGVYYVKSGKKFRAFSETVLRSWRFNILPGNESILKSLKDGGILGFRPGSLISNVADGKLYIIDGTHKRHIKNPRAIKNLGLEGIPIYKVSDAECDLHPQGEDYE